MFPDGQLEVDDFRDVDDRFVYAYRGFGRGRSSGAQTEFTGFGVGTLREGKLSRLELYTRERDALAVVGLDA